MIARSHRSGRRPGATVVEMAFIALICFTFMFAIFEYGRYVFVRQVMENAARAGCRLAVATATSTVGPTTANNNLNATVNSLLASQELSNLTIATYQADNSGNNIGAWTSTPFGRNIVVQIDADLPLLFPTFNFITQTGGAPNSAHITVKSMMRGEAN